MALEKSLLLSSGVVAVYHKIAGVRYSMVPGETSIVDIEVEIYVSKELRIAGKDPVAKTTVSILPSEIRSEDGGLDNAIGMAYNAIKRTPAYSGSTDC